MQDRVDPDKISFKAGVGQTSCTSNIGSAMSTRGTSSAPASFSFTKMPSRVLRLINTGKLSGSAYIIYSLTLYRQGFSKSYYIPLSNSDISKLIKGLKTRKTISKYMKELEDLKLIKKTYKYFKVNGKPKKKRLIRALS